MHEISYQLYCLNSTKTKPHQKKTMNITTIKDELTMSSREISEHTGKLHKNVMRDIRRMFDALGISALSFEGSYRNSQNKTFKEYILPKRSTLAAISGYSMKLRMVIIDRWQELEDARRDNPEVTCEKPTAAHRETRDESHVQSQPVTALYENQTSSKPTNITTTEGGIVMSSREIAARTGKLHKNVLADIYKMFEDLGIDGLRFQSGYQAANNQTRKEYLLPKDLALTLVTGYSVKLRNAVITRWQELEVAQVQPQPLTQIEVVKSYLATLELNEALKIEAAKSAVKVSFYDTIIESGELFQIGAVAKMIDVKGLGPNKLFAAMRDAGILIKSGARKNYPTQKYKNRGLFEVKQSSFYCSKSGMTRYQAVTWVTQRGVTFLFGEFGPHTYPRVTPPIKTPTEQFIDLLTRPIDPLVYYLGILTSLGVAFDDTDKPSLRQVSNDYADTMEKSKKWFTFDNGESYYDRDDIKQALGDFSHDFVDEELFAVVGWFL